MLKLSFGTTLVAAVMGYASAQDCDMNHLLQNLPSVQQACCLQVIRGAFNDFAKLVASSSLSVWVHVIAMEWRTQS